MSTFVAILLLGASGHGMPTLVVHDHFDRVEINHIYDPLGQWQLTQMLCYDFKQVHLSDDQRELLDGPNWLWLNGKKRRWMYVVQHWHIVTPDGPHLYPHKNKAGLYYVIYHDGKDVLRKITAPVYEETHTGYDPEVVRREIRKATDRRGLLNEPPK